MVLAIVYVRIRCFYLKCLAAVSKNASSSPRTAQFHIAKTLLRSYGTAPSRPGTVQCTRSLIAYQQKRTRCASCCSTTNQRYIKCNEALHETCFVKFHTP